MIDILQQDTNDLAIVNNSFVIIDGLQQVKQRIMQVIQTISGEWFLDTSRGLPYFTDLAKKGMKLSTAAEYFREKISLCDGVLAINKLELTQDSVTRALSISLEVKGQTGTISIGVTL